MIAQQLQNLASTQITLTSSDTNISEDLCALQYRAVGLLLLDHLPAVVQSSSKVAKLCICSGSIVEDGGRSLRILTDCLRE